MKSQSIKVANGAKFSILALTGTKMHAVRNALYIHVHRKSRRCYIGVTDMQCGERWNYGAGYLKNRLFGRAIAKHGWGAFDSYVLALLDSREALNRAEVRAIKAAGGHKSQYTYNLSPGGDLVAENDKPLVGVDLKTGEQRRFKSGVAAAKYIECDRDGPSEIARNRGRRRISVRGWWFRFEDDPLSLPPKEFGEAARLAQVRKLQGRPVVAVHYDTLECRSFGTIAEAAKAIGVNTAAVAIVVAGIGKSARGWWFRYADDVDAKLPSIRGIAARAEKRSKRVTAVNLTTGELRTFRGASTAAREMGISEGEVSAVASSQRSNARGWWFTYDPQAMPPKVFGRSALVREARSEPISATVLSTKKRLQFPSAKAAAEALGISRAAISKALNKNGIAKGVRFKRVKA